MPVSSSSSRRAVCCSVSPAAVCEIPVPTRIVKEQNPRCIGEKNAAGLFINRRLVVFHGYTEV